MADSKEKQVNTAPDTDDALQSFLNREQSEQKPVKSSKLNKRALIIIIAVIAVAALAALLIFLRNQPVTSSDDDIPEPAEISLDVDSDGEHTAKIELDDDGNILNNGSGSLLSYVPADISRIEVENTDGSFAVTSTTPEGEATVYTIVGLEDYPLQEGMADEIATDASSLDFTQIISADGELADFGLDKPRATVNVSYQDDTTAAIRVGSEAPAQAGTYIAFGSSNAVYLVENDSVDSFLYSVNEFISLAVTDAAEDTDNSEFTSLTISGSRYDEPITIVPNTDEAISTAYIVTEPRRMYADAIESYDIAGSVRGLYADSVVCVSPSFSQLESYSLAEPYAEVKASYPDTEITLRASEPDENGMVNLYNPDKNIIYTIQHTAVSWAATSIDALMSDYILEVDLNAVSNVSFTDGDIVYSIDVETTVELQDDEEGNTQDVTVTKATGNGKELDPDSFRVFFQNLIGVRNSGDTDPGSSEVISFTYTYNTGRDPDTVTIYSNGTAKYAVVLNGEIIGSAAKSYIDDLSKNPSALLSGDPVTNL